MSSAEPDVLAWLMRLLYGHRQLAYLLLFAGSLLETVLPFALLVPGEVVFLAGATLAGLRQLDLVAVSLALIAGGLAGDHASYWMGRRSGPGIYAWWLRQPWTGRRASLRRLVRARTFMHRRGATAVFLARFAGPLSWVTPLLAGASGLRYTVFSRYNAPAVVLGIGQFIVIGYLCGRHAAGALRMLGEHAWVAVASLPALILVIVLTRRARLRRMRRGQLREPV